MDIQDVLNSLHGTNPELARNVRACFDQIVEERDQAVARAREAIAKSNADEISKARQKLASESQNFVHLEQPPKQFLLRQEFDRLSPAEKIKTVKNGVKIVD